MSQIPVTLLHQTMLLKSVAKQNVLETNKMCYKLAIKAVLKYKPAKITLHYKLFFIHFHEGTKATNTL